MVVSLRDNHNKPTYDDKLLYNDEKDDILAAVNDKAKESSKEILKKMSKKGMTKKGKERLASAKSLFSEKKQQQKTKHCSCPEQCFTDAQLILIFEQSFLKFTDYT